MPIGHLVDEWSGVQHPVAGMVVVGSAPQRDAAVAAGTATMIVIDGPDVDEVHLRIRVDGAVATVEPVTDGTVWIQPAGGPLAPLGPSPETLVDGCQLRIGTRALVFRAASGSGR